MKRIFIMNDFVSGGGAEIVMKNIVTHFHEKYKITVMTMDNDADTFRDIFPDDVEYIAAKIINNPYGKINPLRYLVKAYNLFRKAFVFGRRYDIVIANKEGPCMKCVSWMKAPTKLAWVHVDYRYLYWTGSEFSAQDEVKCMQSFDKVVCVSSAAADSVREVIGDPHNLCVKYNPIDYRSIRQRAEASPEISRDSSKPLFVAVGRMVGQKNYKALSRACARLSREFDFELWIVGDGEQRGDIEHILNEAECSCVKILGMQDNPYKYLKKADVLVSASLGESYGLVIQEALILGVPVLSTRCPAIEECFDTRFGMLVDCNEEAIENGMRYILEHPECIDRFKSAIQNEYDVESLWDGHLKAIEDLFG